MWARHGLRGGARLAFSGSRIQTARLLSSDGAMAQSISLEGCDFHVRTRGESGTPVLLMPGAMGTAETDWTHQMVGLSVSHQVVSFDPRGYGKSRPPARRFPLDYYHRDAADAVAIMRELGHEQFHVMGWSDGANAAVLLADAHPEAVRKLIIFGGNSYITEEDIEAYEATRDIETSWSQRMKDTHVPVYGDELQPMWSSFCDGMKGMFEAGGDICQEQAKGLKCPTLIMGGEKVRHSRPNHTVQAAASPRCTVSLTSSSCVPWVAHACQDPIVPTFHPHWFHKNIPNAQLYMFPEGKHNIHIRFADDFNQIALDFFQ